MSDYRKKIDVPQFELTIENEKSLKGLKKCILKPGAAFDKNLSGVDKIYSNDEKVVLILK